MSAPAPPAKEILLALAVATILVVVAATAAVRLLRRKLVG